MEYGAKYIYQADLGSLYHISSNSDDLHDGLFQRPPILVCFSPSALGRGPKERPTFKARSALKAQQIWPVRVCSDPLLHLMGINYHHLQLKRYKQV